MAIKKLTRTMPATQKQKTAMDNLNIDYDDDITLDEASKLISEEIETNRLDDRYADYDPDGEPDNFYD